MTEKESVENSGIKKEIEGYSYSKKHSIVYRWKINEISSFIKSATSAEENVCINSSRFSTSAKIKDSWFLRLAIERDDESSKSKSWISIFLGPKNGVQKVRAKYMLFLSNNKGEKILDNLRVYNKSMDVWYNKLFASPGVGYGYKKFIKIDELLAKKDEIFENDTLTVCVDLTVYDEYVTKNSTSNSLKSSKRKMCDDFKDLFDAKKRFDIVIEVGEDKFYAHTVILAARSSVFEAMLSNDTIECKKNLLTLQNIDSQTFKKVLDFIYTDRLDNLGSSAKELLEASDKYQLQGLKKLCEDSLLKTITFGNAIDVLIMADNYNAKRLKEQAISYIAIDLFQFENTEQFKALEESHAYLACVVFKKRLAIDNK